MPGRLARARSLVTELAINVALPYAVFSSLDRPLGDVKALLWSSAPPICWSVVEFARARRVDAVSLLALAGIALSLLAFAGGGSVKVLQLRENLVSALIGLAFLGSVAIGKPLVYELARAGTARRSPEELRDFDALRDRPGFRRSMRVITLVWGFGLLAQTALACALVFTLPIRVYLLVGPLAGYAGLGALALWTVWYVRRRRALANAARSPSRDE